MQRLISALLLTMVAGGAHASGSDGIYVGGKYLMLSTDTDISINNTIVAGTVSADPTGLALVVGKALSPNMAVEGTLLVSGSDDSLSCLPFDSGDCGTIEMSSYLDVSIIGQSMVTPQLAVFGRAGLAKVEYKSSDGDKDDDTGVSYGVGAKFAVQPNVSIFLEWMQLPDVDASGDLDQFGNTINVTVDSTSLNLGVQVKM